MLADPRSESIGDQFRLSMARARKARQPRARSGACSPTSTGTSASHFVTEARLFVDSIFREDRSVLDLLTRESHVFERERWLCTTASTMFAATRFRRVELADDSALGLAR